MTTLSISEASKAYGGCTKCYGKGYATQIEFATGRGVVEQMPYYLPCSCDRGKQFADAMKSSYARGVEDSATEAESRLCTETKSTADKIGYLQAVAYNTGRKEAAAAIRSLIPNEKKV